MTASFLSSVPPVRSEISHDFWRGHPNRSLLPSSEIRDVLEAMGSIKDRGRLERSLQYPKSDKGDPFLLREISLFLRRRTIRDALPHNSLEPDFAKDLDMFLTHGVSHGLDLLCASQTSPGNVVMIERPSYFLADGIFRSHGLRIESLPMKRTVSSENDNRESGLTIDIDALDLGLRNGSISVPRMIYIIPTHQNPTGNTIPILDRLRLCELARKFGFLVAADEVYHLLDWSDDGRPARFSVLDQLVSKNCDSLSIARSKADVKCENRMGCSVSLSSFTKILAPGLRCGWIEGPTEIIESVVDLGYIQSQGGCVPFVGNILRTALEKGFQDQILDRLNDSYSRRCQKLCDILMSEPGIKIARVPKGGYFIWVEFSNLPQSDMITHNTFVTEPPISSFAKFCLNRGLKLMPGVMCDFVSNDYKRSQQPKNLCESSARLCFADMDEESVEGGAILLVKLYRIYVRNCPLLS